jgi:Flp pilus assembly protein TadG
MFRRASQRRRRGSTAVETALALPLVFAFMFAIFDIGRAIATKQMLVNATRTAARQAAVGTTTLTTTDIQNIVTTGMGKLALSGMNVQVYQADPTTGANIGPYTKAGNGQCIAVQVTGNFVPNVPTFSMVKNPVAMTSKALVDCEAN